MASLAGSRNDAVHLAGSANAMPNKLLSSLLASGAVLALSASSAIASGTAVAHAAAHTPRYVFTDLGVLPPGLDSQARALSDRGKVVGLADTCPNCGPAGFHAFLWTPARPGGTSGSMTELGTLRGQAKSLATGINNAGRVVGTSFYPTPDKAFIYNGSLHNLGRLHRGSSTEADGINSAGAVVGASGTANGFDHAFLWVPNKRQGIRGRMHDLGTPPGKAISTASAINNKGTIAGSSLNAEFSAGKGLRLAAVTAAWNRRHHDQPPPAPRGHRQRRRGDQRSWPDRRHADHRGRADARIRFSDQDA